MELRYREALDEIRTSAWWPCPHTGVIEHYVITGATASLARIRPYKSSGMAAYMLYKELPPPQEWTEEDRRVMKVAYALAGPKGMGEWLRGIIEREGPEDDFLGILCRKELPRELDRKNLLDLLATGCDRLESEQRVNSLGRYVLTMPDKELKQLLVTAAEPHYKDHVLLKFLAKHAPKRLPTLGEALVKSDEAKGTLSAICYILLECDERAHEPIITRWYQRERNHYWRFVLGKHLASHNLQKYGSSTLNDARTALGEDPDLIHIAYWMADNFWPEVARELRTYVLRAADQCSRHGLIPFLDHVLKARGGQAIHLVRAALGSRDPELCLSALGHLLALDDGTEHDAIRAAFRKGLHDGNIKMLVNFANLAGKYRFLGAQEDLWDLIDHSSGSVRVAAAAALGKMGDEVLVRARLLLEHKKAATRLAAVRILSALNTPPALAALEEQLPGEKDSEVSEAILSGLREAWSAAGKTLSRAMVEEWMARDVAATRKPPAAWLDENRLPVLKGKDGGPLPITTVRYLLARQAKCGEIRPLAGLRPLYDAIDRDSSGDFALFLLQSYLASGGQAKNRWALTVAGLLGDERVVSRLKAEIIPWADGTRWNSAVFGIQALALNGSDASLRAVDALARRYRSKKAVVGRAAVEAFNQAANLLGVTPEELGDGVISWLGFEPGKARVFKWDSREVEVRIGTDFKLHFIDLEKNKRISSLPGGAPAGIKAQIKDLGAGLREAAKEQSSRLEALMVRQYHWPARRWQDLFLRHPVMVPFGVRLVWGMYDEKGILKKTFRALEDGTLTGPDDTPVVLDDKYAVGVVHPLELEEPLLRAWTGHISDYGVDPPFVQLERPTIPVAQGQEQLKYYPEFAGKSLAGLTFKGRAERLGWSHGSVIDAGDVSDYLKRFPAAGVDAFINLEGLCMGAPMDSEVTLREIFFVTSGSVKIGSYEYDKPEAETDPRLVCLGNVRPLVFSEVIGDLRRITAGSS